jgi:hypothetical protein
MRTIFARAVGAISVFVFAVACGGGPAASGQGVPSLSVPSLSVPSFAIPSFAIPSFAIPSGLSSFAIPSFVIPSFNTNVDPELAARFPQQIDGQPVERIQTVRFLDFATALGTDQEGLQRFVQILASAGIDANAVTFGTGRATVNDDDVDFSAFRAPGVPAAQLLAVFPQISTVLDPDRPVPTVGSTTIAGKAITTLTPPEGDTDYFYPSGDVVWSVESDDQAVLETVFGAIQ